VSLTDRVVAYFRAHPGEWIDGRVLATVGGAYAWRSRVSDARRQGLDIENRTRRVRNGLTSWTVSEYRYRSGAVEQAAAPLEDQAPA
jgi:hypothetical protein